MVEVYNEAVYDLLSPPEGVREKLTIQKQGKDMVVQVREGRGGEGRGGEGRIHMLEHVLLFWCRV